MIPTFIPGLLFLLCWALVLRSYLQHKQIKDKDSKLNRLKKSIGEKNYSWILESEQAQ